MKGINNFLLYCGGTNFSIIKRCPSDIDKMVGIGGVVFFTGIMAFISSSYAIYKIFDNIFFAVGFGILWGLMIFNLDRFIVSSLRKTGSVLRQMIMALPRLCLAIILGIVISKPLELKIFEKEIDKQILEIIEKNKRFLQQAVDKRYDTKNLFLNNKKDSIISRLNNLKNEYNNATLELEKEIVGTASSTTSGKLGFGSNAKRKQELKSQKEIEYINFKNSNQNVLDSIDDLLLKENQLKQNETKQMDVVQQSYNGIAARMQALTELGQKYPIIESASVFIMLLFILIEISPILVKIISPKSPYDYILELTEQSYFWKNKEEKAVKNILVNTRIETIKQYIENNIKTKF